MHPCNALRATQDILLLSRLTGLEFLAFMNASRCPDQQSAGDHAPAHPFRSTLSPPRGVLVPVCLCSAPTTTKTLNHYHQLTGLGFFAFTGQSMSRPADTLRSCFLVKLGILWLTLITAWRRTCKQEGVGGGSVMEKCLS